MARRDDERRRNGQCCAAAYSLRAKSGTGRARAHAVGALLFSTLLLLLFLSVAAPSVLPAQTRRSQRGSVMQMVGQTRIEITYSRPVARGRTLFGALVPWGRVWNPGADTATAISVSTPVRINDRVLPAGAYSLWAIPGQERWTIIFHRRTPVWHIPYPGDGEVALRVDAVPERGSHLETLTYYFPVVEGLTATLHLHWGETIVPLAIRVE